MGERLVHANDTLRALLAEARWTYAELARAVNEAGAENGLVLRYDRSSVGHWIQGTRPRAEVGPLIAEVFTRKLGRAFSVADLGWADWSEQAHSTWFAEPWHDAVGRLAALSRADAEPGRHPGVPRPVYNIRPVVTPPWSSAPGLPDGRRVLSRRRVGDEEVAALRDFVSVFSSFWEGHGGGAVVLASCVSRVATVWLSALSTDEVHRRLLSQTSRMSYLLGRMRLDEWNHGPAQQYFFLCLDLAREADDRAMYALGLRALSAQARDLGHQQQALRFAEAAVDHLDRAAAPPVRSFVHAQLAVSRAEAGDRPLALAAWQSAEHWSGVPYDHDPGDPFDFYSPKGLRFQKARFHDAMGEPSVAIGELRVAAERGPEERLPRALTRAELGTLLLRHGYLEEACAAWQGFLEDYPRLNSTRADRELRSLRRQLRVYDGHVLARSFLHRAARAAP